jgi:protein-S-isoprenylcysteine O-methyltransferase Ste14
MFPVLVVIYVHLAHGEEREALAEFGAAYQRYRGEVPAFFPRLRDLVASIRQRCA